jgi:hypothetical protein
MRIVVIMAMIMEQLQESDPFTLFRLDRPQMVDCLRQIEARYTRYPQTLKKYFIAEGSQPRRPVCASGCCKYLGLLSATVHQ